MSEQKDRISALVEGVVGARQMENTRDYLTRGRSFFKTETDELKRRWIEVTGSWLQNFGAMDLRETDDLTAELCLRHIDLPYESLKSELEAIRKEMLRNPEQGRAEIRKHSSALLNDLDKPPN